MLVITSSRKPFHMKNPLLVLCALLCAVPYDVAFVKATKIDPLSTSSSSGSATSTSSTLHHDDHDYQHQIRKMSLPMKKPQNNNKHQDYTNHDGAALLNSRNRDLADNVNPPFWGTIFNDGDIITNFDTTSLETIELYDETQCVIMYDRRTNSFLQDDEAHIFDVTFSDGIVTQFWVRGTDYGLSQAEQLVLLYAGSLGRVPQSLRINTRVATIQAGDEPWGGSGGGILTIHAGNDYTTDGNNGDDISVETLVHELGHVTLDSQVYSDTAWDDAVAADPGYISEYARDYPDREDVAESIVLWLGIALGTLNSDDAAITTAQIPNRLAYFDQQGYNLFPLGGGTGGILQGYTWEEIDSFYYPCGTWEGGNKSVIYPKPEETVAPTASPTKLEETVAPTASPTKLEEIVAPTASPTKLEETVAPTASPTTPEETVAPTASPTKLEETVAPTASPTELTTSSSCEDSTARFRLTWQGKNISRGCTWVANKLTSKRCDEDGVAAMCSFTCGACDTCVDSTTRFRLTWNGKNISRGCTWVANKLTSKRCDEDGVAEACRLTCGKC